jgi:hypothetical protein
MNCEQLAILLSYEKNMWAHVVSTRWISLCTSLQAYEAPDNRCVTSRTEAAFTVVMP